MDTLHRAIQNGQNYNVGHSTITIITDGNKRIKWKRITVSDKSNRVSKRTRLIYTSRIFTAVAAPSNVYFHFLILFCLFARFHFLIVS
jgi:hypothetical protein